MSALVQHFGEFLMSAPSALALPIEKEFDPAFLINWSANNYPLVFGLVAAYLVFISAGSLIMDKYKPFDLRLSLAAWNAFLCVFSFIGMCKTVSSSKFMHKNPFTYFVTSIGTVLGWYAFDSKLPRYCLLSTNRY
jgi:hypothetical protein